MARLTNRHLIICSPPLGGDPRSGAERIGLERLNYKGISDPSCIAKLIPLFGSRFCHLGLDR